MTVPVLMYHAVAERPSDATYGLSVHPDRFAEQLDLLAAEGFTTITVGELAAIRRGEATAPERPIALTFDDGYADFHREALPRLTRAGATATLFVTTGWLDDAGTEAAGQPLDRMLSWSQVAECDAAGVEIGAHSHSHAQLDQLADGALRDELARPKRLLAERLGHEVPHLAYPYGYSSARVRRAVADAGYRLAASVGNFAAARGADGFAVPRLTVARTTDLATFGRVVRGEHHARIYWKERTLTAGYLVVRRSRSVVSRSALAGRVLS
ncbi:polysaccharide deacetylase [Actinomycetospora succinea]|uniref:Polysaccharide deacetylase n=1 Tax=Actinomycetospora succinea TaxID=663603 RepID=A0A4R6UP27_9PSEU|nr:polysaccharide deacetylase family protein [Actinomycetospora succinea]TDQ48920.1 polysaccharide deacetylase [Actinomycetospora succinea]